MKAEFKEQVKLLLDVLPFVGEEDQLALHGGTAINLFVRDMPRLSVEIDLTYITIEERAITIENINELLFRLKVKLETRLIGSTVQVKPNIGKLFINKDNATIKLEINLVGRGLFDNPQKMLLSKVAQQQYDTFVEVKMVPFAQLYGGKICAALDRQHPRDLFDVKFLLDREGINDEIKKGFIYSLLGSERPIYEILNPNLLNQREALINQFEGMTDIPFGYECYESTRELLIKEIHRSLSEKDKNFLMSFKTPNPDWTSYPFEQFPSVRWKYINLQNLKSKNAIKYKEQVIRLEEFLVHL